MARVYHCVTENYLNKTKRFFDTQLECIEHVKKMIALKPEWVNKRKALKSFHITAIDTELLPEYQKIFKVFEGIMDIDPPTKREIFGNKKKNKKQPENMPAQPKQPPKKEEIPEIVRKMVPGPLD
jgi:hypothetical protein